MDFQQQIQRGLLVCPRTRLPLRPSSTGNSLVTVDGTYEYPVLEGKIPVLLVDQREAESYWSSSERMTSEYQPEAVKERSSLWYRIKTHSYRSRESLRAFDETFAHCPEDALILTIGGGPDRWPTNGVNVNIGPFPNVDIVADALCLPYAENSVDAICCEAVLEHLLDPAKAVNEMYRVLKPGGRVFAATPFLQPYHGYPYHFQNFTISGHTRLFEVQGFQIRESGVCVGPSVMLSDLVRAFIVAYAPAFLRLPLQKLWGLCALFIRPLDILIGRHPNAHMFASTTYLVAVKE